MRGQYSMKVDVNADGQIVISFDTIKTLAGDIDLNTSTMTRAASAMLARAVLERQGRRLDDVEPR